ncbi:MAG: MFS transporter, partial [Dongiales bacterium]
MTKSMDGRTRWLALVVLCLGDLMIVLDSTIVNVALPSIRTDLGFSETALVWVVNAYLLTFGGFLLLGGRLGDLFGHRRLFLLGVAFFTLASLACGLANSQALLVMARAVQGIVIALSLLLLPADRRQASGQRLDIAGAVTVTISLMLAVYAIVNGNQVGWLVGQTLGLLLAALALLALFLVIESRVAAPLMPLGLFRLRNVATAN